MVSVKPSSMVLAGARNAFWPLLRRTRYRLLNMLRTNPLDADIIDPVVEALANAEAALIGRDQDLKPRRGRGPRVTEAPPSSDDTLRARIRELERELSQREEHIAMIAHDLRNPLSPVLLMANRMMEEAHRRDVDSVSLEWLRPRAESLNQRLGEFVGRLNRLLDATRLQTGHLSLAPESLDLVKLTRQVVADARQGSSFVEISVEGVEELVGRWDRMRLEQIIGNLVSNALRYSALQPITIAIARTGDLARVSVRDRGIGIAPEDQARIFERYVRVGTKGTGLGLGLWIVRELCEAMGGSVTVTSDRGAGSTFVVTLPLHARST
jgi:signal transduction histidine kinase